MANALLTRQPPSLKDVPAPADALQVTPQLLRKAGDRIRGQYGVQSDGRFNGFLKALAVRNPHQRREAVEKTYSTVEKTQAMEENQGIAGGYLAPLEYTTELMMSLAESSFIWPRARVLPMTSADLQCPIIDATTVQNAGIAPYWGGMSWAWTGNQGTALTQTQPQFRQTTLKAWDLVGYAVVSNQFLADIGPEGEQALIRIFGEAAGYQAEYAFLVGLGASNSQPLGMLTSPCALSYGRAGASHIVQADLIGMASLLLPWSWRTAVWCCNPSCLPEVLKVTGFIPNQNFEPGGGESGLAGSLYCRPLFVTDKLPLLGTPGDIMLVDPNLYVIGDRQAVVVEASPTPQFQNNQTSFRVWLRRDGLPLLNNFVTATDASSKLSSVIYLTKGM